LSAIDHTDVTGVLARIVSGIPEAILATELARRADEARRLHLSNAPQPAATRPPIRGPPDDERLADTVQQFCLRYNISRSSLYEQWREGVGPRFYRIGSVKRISRQAGEDWLREREAEAAA
jgi:hypothetical protein